MNLKTKFTRFSRSWICKQKLKIRTSVEKVRFSTNYFNRTNNNNDSVKQELHEPNTVVFVDILWRFRDAETSCTLYSRVGRQMLLWISKREDKFLLCTKHFGWECPGLYPFLSSYISSNVWNSYIFYIHKKSRKNWINSIFFIFYIKEGSSTNRKNLPVIC